MRVGEVCNREVIVIDGDESAAVAMRLMRDHHVGDVVVTESRGDQRVPIGIITDRDLVLEVMIPGIAPEQLAARDLFTGSLATVGTDDSLLEALERMRARGVRRLPVVSVDGALAGILTVDDVMELLTEMLGSLSAVVERQQARETRERP